MPATIIILTWRTLPTTCGDLIYFTSTGDTRQGHLAGCSVDGAWGCVFIISIIADTTGLKLHETEGELITRAGVELCRPVRTPHLHRYPDCQVRERCARRLRCQTGAESTVGTNTETSTASLFMPGDENDNRQLKTVRKHQLRIEPVVYPGYFVCKQTSDDGLPPAASFRHLKGAWTQHQSPDCPTSHTTDDRVTNNK